MGVFESLCWILTILATVAAGLFLFVTFSGANGAPQQAAGAAMAAAMAIIPYVFTRGVQAFGRDRVNVPGAGVRPK
jgi:hypothetical protein